MEEEIIKKSFCNYCQNKRNNCMKIQIEEKNEVKTYKCINYNKGIVMSLNNSENYSKT